LLQLIRIVASKSQAPQPKRDFSLYNTLRDSTIAARFNEASEHDNDVHMKIGDMPGQESKRENGPTTRQQAWGGGGEA